MGRLANIRQITSENFAPEDRDLINKLGTNLNFFMRQVINLSNGNIDFDNLTFDIRTFTVSVDANGNPINSLDFRSSVTSPKGTIVINATNTTNPGTYPTNAPFMTITPQGGGIARVNNITGLQANDQYLITVIVI